MTNLITEARELCADAQLEAALLELKTMSGWLNKVVYHKLGIRWSFDNNNLIHWIVVFMRLLPELCDALEKAQAEIDRLREAQRWVPVSERLPEIDVAVLVMHNYQSQEYSPITIGRLFQPSDKRRKPYWTFVSVQASDGSVYNDGTDFICPGSEFVTHWMPLPAPPEKEGEGK